MIRRKRNLLVLGAAGMVAAFALSGCGAEQAGSAAVVGSTPITEGELTTEVEQVVTGLSITPSAQVNRVMLQRLVLEELVDQLASEYGVSVTEGEIQSFIDDQAKKAGSLDAFNSSLLRNGVPPESVNGAVQMSLQLEKLGQKIAPGKSQQEQQMAVSMAAINVAGQEGIEINPRFGIWEPSALQISPTPDTLSQPAVIPDQGLTPITQ